MSPISSTAGNVPDRNSTTAVAEVTSGSITDTVGFTVKHLARPGPSAGRLFCSSRFSSGIRSTGGVVSCRCFTGRIGPANSRPS